MWEKGKLGNYAGLLNLFKSILSFVGLRMILCEGFAVFCNLKRAPELFLTSHTFLHNIAS